MSPLSPTATSAHHHHHHHHHPSSSSVYYATVSRHTTTFALAVTVGSLLANNNAGGGNGLLYHSRHHHHDGTIRRSSSPLHISGGGEKGGWGKKSFGSNNDGKSGGRSRSSRRGGGGSGGGGIVGFVGLTTTPPLSLSFVPASPPPPPPLAGSSSSSSSSTTTTLIGHHLQMGGKKQKKQRLEMMIQQPRKGQTAVRPSYVLQHPLSMLPSSSTEDEETEQQAEEDEEVMEQLTMDSSSSSGGASESETKSTSTSSSSSSSSSTTTPSLSLEATLYMSLLALQFGFQPLLVRKYTPQGINKSGVVLMQEIIKFFIAGGVYFGANSKEVREEDLDGWSVKQWFAIAAIPAALYSIQNIASLLAYQNLEPLTFNVLNQTKTLSAALCCYLVMKKKQSKVQMFSLLLLLGSALVIEGIVSIDMLKPGGTGGIMGMFAAISNAFGSGATKHVTQGVLPVLLASFLSGLAGALTQKNLQGASRSGEHTKKPRNAYLFSCELNAASVILLLTSLFFSGDGRQIIQSGFFNKWTPKTLIPIVTNALGGIIVGLVTKYAGSVRKGFALIFGILISGLLQSRYAGVTSAQIVGGLLAAVSLWLHTSYPYKPRPPKSKAETTAVDGA